MGDENIKTQGIADLIEVMESLRGPEGCPWDRKQTHQTLGRFLQEECGELLDAIDDGDDEAIREELGDVLMHLVFHSVIADERGSFNFDEVASLCAEKMRARHPHVFGEEKVSCAEEVVGLWENIKAREKADAGREGASILDGIPRKLSALLQARKVQKKAAEVGFDWEEQNSIVDKVEEELDELKEAIADGNEEAIDEEIGDFLFALVNLNRFRNRDTAEELLGASVKKFCKRFRQVEKGIQEKGKELSEASIEEMEELWQEAKRKP